MDLKEWLPEFLSEFHRQQMKPLGFRKVGRTFSREMGMYWERFNFQGSMSNYPGVDKWRFYVNVGVEFKDRNPRQYWKLFPHTHMATRLDYLAPGAPKWWEYDLSTDGDALARKLIALITKASQGIAANSDKIRDLYDAGDENRTRWF